MPIMTIADLAAALGASARVAGLDVGSKTIGVAISDPARRVASPLDTIRRNKFNADAERLFALLDSRDAAALVVGLPLNMDGSEGPRCQSTRAFAANLLGLRDAPLALWDERLSTMAVERVLVAEADMSRAKRARVVDKMAAAYILQGALDAMARASTT